MSPATDIIPYLQQFSERIHAPRRGDHVPDLASRPARRRATPGTGCRRSAPSRVRETRHRSFPREMDAARYRPRRQGLCRGGAGAARRAGSTASRRVTGGHLIGQFLSPRTNRRTDEFGGSTENRARFGLMVHEAIRRRVGDDFLVGIRFVVDEGTDGRHRFRGMPAARPDLRARRRRSISSTRSSAAWTPTSALAEHNMPGMSQPLAPFLHTRRRLQARDQAAGVPRRAHPRHRDGASCHRRGPARHGGDDAGAHRRPADRQQARARRGRAHPPLRRRPYCMYKKVACIHNPATGREADAAADHRARRRSRAGKIVVVGGGPAGLEAARVARRARPSRRAVRGGDQARRPAAHRRARELAARPDRASSTGGGGAANSSASRCGSTATPRRRTCWPSSPDAVIVATGGVPDTDWLAGAEHCTSVWDVLIGATAGEARCDRL